MSVRVVAVTKLDIIPFIDLGHYDTERLKPESFGGHIFGSKDEFYAVVGRAVDIEAKLVEGDRATTCIDLGPSVVKLADHRKPKGRSIKIDHLADIARKIDHPSQFHKVLEPDHGIRAALNVDGIDKADAFGIGRHNHRMRSFA